MAGKFLSAVAAVVIALGCAPVASADCAVLSSNPSTIDGVFADIPGFTVEQGCPAIASRSPVPTWRRQRATRSPGTATAS